MQALMSLLAGITEGIINTTHFIVDLVKGTNPLILAAIPTGLAAVGIAVGVIRKKLKPTR